MRTEKWGGEDEEPRNLVRITMFVYKSQTFIQQHSIENKIFHTNSLKNISKSESKKFFEKAFSTPFRAGKTWFFNWHKN